jgi:hypothetical protein
MASLTPRALQILVLLAACDSTSPAPELQIQVEGQVLEAAQAPTPPLFVEMQAWPDPADTGSVVLETDAAGRYQAELGPFPEGLIDSLVVRVTQDDCQMRQTTELWQRDLRVTEGSPLTLPSMVLSYRLRPAQLGIGGACAGIIHPRTDPSGYDHAKLALWIDEVTDSVRGRWRLNHSASVGDDYGYFSGALESGVLRLQLRPTEPTPCTGLQVDIPIGGDNGSIMEAASLAGDGSCSAPNTMVRFFDGAILGELLPPL